jgi:hypothetical protein
MRRVCVRSDFSASNRFWVQRFKPLRHPARDDFTGILQTFSRALVDVLAGRLDFIQRKGLTESASPARLASAADNLPEQTSQPSSIATHSYETRIGYPRKSRGARSSSRYADVTARDIFNRSFGVLSAVVD